MNAQDVFVRCVVLACLVVMTVAALAVAIAVQEINDKIPEPVVEQVR